jgi:hypothetical protein
MTSTSVQLACIDGQPVVIYQPGNHDTQARWVSTWTADRSSMIDHGTLAPGESISADGAAWVWYPTDADDAWRAIDTAELCSVATTTTSSTTTPVPTTSTTQPAPSTTTTTEQSTTTTGPLSLVTIVRTTPEPPTTTALTSTPHTLPETGASSGDIATFGLWLFCAGIVAAGLAHARRKDGGR